MLFFIVDLFWVNPARSDSSSICWIAALSTYMLNIMSSFGTSSPSM